MAEQLAFTPVAGPIDTHPAWLAWQQVSIGAQRPAGIEALTDASGRLPKRKSTVYRLVAATPTGEAIVAKCTGQQGIRTERVVYDILSILPVTSLRCYGSLELADQARGWIFLEEAIGEVFENSDPDHRVLAARWLGELHSATADNEVAARLRDHGPERYASCLPEGRNRILDNLDNPSLTAAGADKLREILEVWDRVESHWPDLKAEYDRLPRCLVHGDFDWKNVRVSGSGTARSIWVMDWDISGWGAPAIDIDNQDPVVYRQAIQDRWPEMGLDEIGRMANLGGVLKNVGLIHATSLGLEYEWLDEVIADLSIYYEHLASALHRLRWVERSR